MTKKIVGYVLCVMAMLTFSALGWLATFLCGTAVSWMTLDHPVPAWLAVLSTVFMHSGFFVGLVAGIKWSHSLMVSN